MILALLVSLWLANLSTAEANPERRLYSIVEVADMLSVHPAYVYELAYSGRLPTVKLGRRRLVPAEALDAFIADLSE